jgi:uncharacterized protein YecE (DUF72 family)
MEFGKVQDLSDIDFHLPSDPPGNAARLSARHHPPHAATLYIGATGWSVPEWRGTLYPARCRPDRYLFHYSRQFNTIEHNTTHYRIPEADTIRRWREQAAPDFRFCPKVLQRISHAPDLGGRGELVGRFASALEGLGGLLGPCFLQLPPYFGPDKLPVLEQFLAHFPLPLAVELRHPDWFAIPRQWEALTGCLADHGVATVITDVAGRRDVCHMTLTTPVVLIRFVGNDGHPSDLARLDDWADRLAAWSGQGLRAAYFFIHSPDALHVPGLAGTFRRMLADRCPNLALRGPTPLQPDAPPEQLSLF